MAADLRGADLREANLSDAICELTDFGLDATGGRTVLADTILYGAQLHHAILTDVDLSGALYDSRTTFPPGFSPERHGMRRS
jgi:uncharacterized protein YjbI with pentapeptide repeats